MQTPEQRSATVEAVRLILEDNAESHLQGIEIDPTPENTIITSQAWSTDDNQSHVFVTTIAPDGTTSTYEEH